MTGLEIWLLAIGLAMDCFAVSIASGIILKRTRWRPMLIMTFAFGLFQAIMPLIGWMCVKTFSHLIESIDHWIAFGILAFLGGRMIWESFKEEECCQPGKPEGSTDHGGSNKYRCIGSRYFIRLFRYSGLQWYPFSYPHHRICFIRPVINRAYFRHSVWLRPCPKVKSWVMGRYHSGNYRN